MTVFGISSEDHTHGCNKVCALVNQGADAVGRGFRQVKGMFVQESLRSEMGRAYNEGYKLSPELVGKVMALVAVVLGTIPLAMTVLPEWLFDLSCTVGLPICAAIAAGATAVFIKALGLINKESAIGGLIGGVAPIAVNLIMAMTERRMELAEILSNILSIECASVFVIGACVAVPFANLASAIGKASGKVIGGFTPVRHLCGATAAVAAMVARPFKG
jgi:hypothetical protein